MELVYIPNCLSSLVIYGELALDNNTENNLVNCPNNEFETWSIQTYAPYKAGENLINKTSFFHIYDFIICFYSIYIVIYKNNYQKQTQTNNYNYISIKIIHF